jgi:hypothetical protein
MSGCPVGSHELHFHQRPGEEIGVVTAVAGRDGDTAVFIVAMTR